ncbi:P-loop containing nucleoside triphosphate hydrolase protein [Fomitiporia mediterranea MF3/22]|uniref:P-loop containing nucleoside triphosphate hydrolase protein n=1 Tax=Fomitiporia mediterranea (strain MF3/22) TaxID=694068 RepID=UPI0004408B6D|nr:P-loop containing nucleoside triphosphate hydrolase protein [Fomitiporia mediterranea MF3/22]EJD05824.1 P-loop containing nucleoside triphosphate hydrolase protein [Fomitiporia mediterranea MF3/22]
MAKVEPLSIESLLEKQRAEREAASKPKFLSKEERAKLAIEKRAQEIRGQKEKEESQRREREALEREADALRDRERFRDEGNRYGRGSRYDDRNQDRERDGRYGRRDQRGPRRDDRDRDRDRAPPSSGLHNVPTAPRADRERSAATSHSASPAPSVPPPAVNGSSTLVDTSSTFVPQMNDNDLSAIRSRYLGVDKKKRKIRKMNDRKFVFDWDEQDDTLAEDSPTAAGANRQGAQVMFGRGHLAGMDDGGGVRRGSGNAETKFSDTLERRKAAKSGLDERHWTEKPLSQMKDRDWRIFREDFSIATRGGQIPHPLRSWTESEIPPTILEVVEKVGYKEPSAIQRQAIPIGLQNRDLIGIAETGSGKTAAFVIPMLTYISNLPPFTEDNRHLGPYALILAPTRELAQQIESETRKFASPLGFKCVSIVGGRSVEEQQFNLREGAEIIIATPGRLKDVIERHVIVLSQCSYIVMDEADRMVNLGFEVDLTFILDKLPSEMLKGEDEGMMDVDGEMVRRGRTRVTTLFSATMPPAVERLTRKYLKKPAIVTIGEAGRAVDTVEQRVEFINGDEKKRQRMIEILSKDGFPAPIIVFVNQKKTADMVCRDVQRAGVRATTLHSGKNQEQREAALQSLRNGESDVLVATDLAGRGIDVQDVSLVLNYQMANTIEAYVHRIGRTGRAGKVGTAITFLTNDDDEVMYDLRQEISKSPVSKVPPELAKHEASQARVTREMKRKRDADDQG